MFFKALVAIYYNDDYNYRNLLGLTTYIEIALVKRPY
jgi:hypothetical protein